MAHITVPDDRLLSAIPYLTRGGRIADVGTDHAYLPIYLVSGGYVREALASDINEGPIRSARQNIRAAGLEESIRTLRTDGLCGVESFRPDDVLIFGMGGELITSILQVAGWIRDPAVGLILQPMTRAHVLRKWLCDNGFEITGESLTADGERIYQTMSARFCGKTSAYTEEELLLGKKNIERNAPLFRAFVERELRVTESILAGKEKSGNADPAAERRAAEFLRRRLEAL